MVYYFILNTRSSFLHSQDDDKPTWDEDIDIGDIAPSVDELELVSAPKKKSKKQLKKEERKKAKAKALAAENGDAEGIDVDMMDADADVGFGEEGDEEEWDGTEEMRKRKVAEYMDELYGMEFNDIVGFPFLPLLAPLLPLTFASYRISA